MRLHFREYGQGPPLIILHGLFGSLDNWGAVATRLAPEFHVYAVDQRTHGGSAHSAEMDYIAMANDLRQFMEEHSLGRAHVLGHSMGGKTAMQFALLNAAKVDHLIVVDIAPRAHEPEHEFIFAALFGLDLPRYQSRVEIEQALAPAIRDLAVRRFLLKNLVRTPAGAFDWRFNLAGLHRNYGALAGGVEPGGMFDGPTLFVRGEKSEYLNEGDWPAIRARFPRARLVVIPGAGHWVHVEAPDLFLAAVKNFLTEQI